MRALHSFLAICTIASAVVLTVQAQGNSVKPRITGVIDESQLVTLSGNVPSTARAEFDLGEVQPGTELTSMRLVLSRTAAQEQALASFMAAQQNPNSPYYQHWLTPAQYGKIYGASGEDINSIMNWLTSRGFSVERVDSGRMSIAFSGKVVDVENAFHTQIHEFSVNGESFYSNITDPQIPAALSPVVVGIAHLNTIKPKPTSTRGRDALYDKAEGKFKPLQSDYQPEFTSNGFLWVTAQDAATIYDTPNSTLNVNYSSGTTYDGTGISIGIGGDSLIQASTVWDYRNRFLNQPIPTASTPTTEPCGSQDEHCTGNVAVSQDGLFTIYNVNHATKNGDADEAYIDTELSGGMAPGAKVNYYVSTDLNSAIEQMLYDDRDNVFSLSFGECESQLGTAGNLQVSNWWKQAAAQGISVFVSTGDSGSAGCDYNVTYSTGGLAVNGLASTLYNVGVGGTDYYPLLSQFSTYVNSTNNALYGSAIGFIPESTWNDSTTNNTTYNLNVNSGNGATAGSGGISSCALAGCVGYAKPSWQAGPGVPADGVRDIPDISLFAANGYYNATWLICTDDVYNGHTENCASYDQQGDWTASGYGGTSTSSPATAGIFAILDQQQGHSIGLPNPILYALAAGAHSSSVFHDVTVGNISVPCSSAPNSSQCVAAASGNFLTGYNTGTGYDTATGLGSLDVKELLNYWSSAIGTNTAAVAVNPATSSLKINQSLTVNGSVTGSSGTATGIVVLSATGYTSTAQALNNGNFTFTIPANTFAVGQVTLKVNYYGDTTYAPANGTALVTYISLSTPTVVVTPAQGSITSSSTLNVTAAVSGSAGTATGTVVFSSGSYTSSAQTLSSGQVTLLIPACSLGGTAAGQVDTITATYSGDTNYSSGNGTNTVTVTAATPTVTLTPGAASINTSQTLSLSTTVTGGCAPTGTVTYSVSGSNESYSSTAQNLSSGSNSFTIPAYSLTGSTAGQTDTITASYSGDSANASAPGTTTATVYTAYSMSVADTSVTHGSSATPTLSVIGYGGFVSQISVTCAVTTSPSGAIDPPTCSGGNVTAGTTGTPGTLNLTIGTTGASAAPGKPLAQNGVNWKGAAGGLALAVLLFFGIPARSRKWRAMLGVLVLFVAIGYITGCGSSGGNGGGGGGGGSNGTTAGNYKITVTGPGKISTSFTLTVN